MNTQSTRIDPSSLKVTKVIRTSTFFPPSELSSFEGFGFQYQTLAPLGLFHMQIQNIQKHSKIFLFNSRTFRPIKRLPKIKGEYAASSLYVHSERLWVLVTANNVILLNTERGFKSVFQLRDLLAINPSQSIKSEKFNPFFPTPLLVKSYYLPLSKIIIIHGLSMKPLLISCETMKLHNLELGDQRHQQIFVDPSSEQIFSLMKGVLRVYDYNLDRKTFEVTRKLVMENPKIEFFAFLPETKYFMSHTTSGSGRRSSLKLFFWRIEGSSFVKQMEINIEKCTLCEYPELFGFTKPYLYVKIIEGSDSDYCDSVILEINMDNPIEGIKRFGPEHLCFLKKKSGSTRWINWQEMVTTKKLLIGSHQGLSEIPINVLFLKYKHILSTLS